MIQAEDEGGRVPDRKRKFSSEGIAERRLLAIRLASAVRVGRIGALVLIFSMALAVSAPAFAQTSPTLTTLYSFDLYPDGANPQGSLVADANGNLFGTTSNGGYNFAGTVFEIVRSQCTSSGCPVTTLLSFNYSDGAYPAAGLIFDANGNLYGTATEGGSYGTGCSYGGCGTVFEIVNNGSVSNPSYSSTANTLVEFDGNDGDDPIAGLTLGANGNLLGTTDFGGYFGSSCYYYGCGTAFEIVNTSGSASSPTYSTTVAPTALANFDAYPHGAEPQAGLLVDGAGNLLGTSSVGGGGYGTVFEIVNNGTLSAPNYSSTPTTLCTFPGGTGGSNPEAGLIADSNGNLFGTTAGNYSSDGTVFEIVNTNGNASNPSYSSTPVTLYSFTGGADGAHPEAGLIVDAKGNLFGTTYAGGSTSGICSYTGGCGTIFEIVNHGTVSQPSYSTTAAPTILYTFTGGSDSANPQAGLIADASGNLYGTTEGGYFSFGSVFELTNSGFVPPVSPLQYEYAKLKIINGRTPGFDLQTAFETTGPSFDPKIQPVQLTVGGYSVTIPAGSFHVLPNGQYAGAWVYTGVIDNVTVSVQIDPLGGNIYEFKANASPVSLSTGLTSINVSITVGNNAGSTTVTPSY